MDRILDAFEDENYCHSLDDLIEEAIDEGKSGFIRWLSWNDVINVETYYDYMKKNTPNESKYDFNEYFGVEFEYTEEDLSIMIKLDEIHIVEVIYYKLERLPTDEELELAKYNGAYEVTEWMVKTRKNNK